MQGDKDILNKTIGKVLMELRKKSGKSLTLFCYEYSLPKSTVNYYERGIKTPFVFQLMKIVKAHNITMSEFFEMVEKELPKDFLNPEE